MLSTEEIEGLQRLSKIMAENIDSSVLLDAYNLDATRFYDYQHDPVGFCEDYFGETYTDDIKRMMESVRDNRVTICVSANSTGKTHGAARTALWWWLTREQCRVYTAAAPPESNLRTLLWGEINTVIQKYPSMFKTNTIRVMHIEKTPEDFMTGVAIPADASPEQQISRFSGKHSANLLFILDEGDGIPDPVYTAIEMCMTGGIARLLVMFNPKQRKGVPYRMIRDGEANVVELSALNHPNVKTGREVIPRAVDRESVVRRINKWSRPMTQYEKVSEASTFEIPIFLNGAQADNQKGGVFPPLRGGEKRVITVPTLSFAVLGRYPAEGFNTLISEEWINLARSRWDAHTVKFGERPPEGTRAVIGLDAADGGPDKNCLISRYGGYVPMPKIWNGVDMVATGDRASTEYRKLNAINCFVDANGVGAGVAPHMRRLGCPGAESILVQRAPTRKSEEGTFRIMRDQIHWLMREWLRTDPGAMLPPDEELLEELRVFTYEIVRGNIEILKRDEITELLGRSPDKASALALTFSDPVSDNRGRVFQEVQVDNSYYWG